MIETGFSDYLPIEDLSTVIYVLEHCGFRGGLRSIIASLRYAESFPGFVLGKHVTTEIASTATINVSGYFVMDVTGSNVAHHSMGGSYLNIDEDATFTIPEDCIAFTGSCSAFNILGDFTMGNSIVNGLARVYCRDEIEIGDGCRISWNVDILDHNGDHDLWIDGKQRASRGPIKIKDNVWIGHSSTIQKGVSIGEGAVVASNTLVTNDVPPNSLVGGVPAKIIEHDVEWGT